MIEFKTADDGRKYFVLKANNGEVVGNPSQMYGYLSQAEAGADAVMKAVGEYWAQALATRIEEWNQAYMEEKSHQIPVREIVKRLIDLNNDDLQEIIDRIPYPQKDLTNE